MSKRNYNDWTKEDLIKEVEMLKRQKTYGLVWEKDKTREVFDYYINWDGIKTKEVFKESENKFPVLKEIIDKKIITNKSRNSNLLIEGDNYHSLAVLNFTHNKAIDVIYIDPPYNRGNHDFRYNDRWVDEEDGYKHSKWLSFMEKRLKLAKNLLKATGIIFISIDDNELAQLKILCDEIFGERNSLGITVRVSNSAKNNSNNISITHDYCLVYCKNRDILSKDWQVPKNNYKEFERIAKSLRNKGISLEEIEEELKILTKYPRFYDFDHYYYCDDVDVYRTDNPGGVKKGNFTSEIYHPITKKPCKKPIGGWRYSEETIQDMLQNNLWHFGKDENTIPAPKRYLKDYLYQKPVGVMFFDSQSDTKKMQNQGIIFEFPKPIDYIKQLLRMIGNSNAVILDFFAGSGTTGHAVLELNSEDDGQRQFILCTNNENNICTDVCYPRIQNAIKGYTISTGVKVKELMGNLRYYQTAFVNSSPTDSNKKAIVDKSTEMLCIKEGAFDSVIDKEEYKIFTNNNAIYLGIIFNDEFIQDFINDIKNIDGKFNVYSFSLDGSVPTEDFKDLKKKVNLCPIPEVILHVYRRIFKND